MGNDTRPLTARQKAILAFIEAYRERHGMSPSYREIQTRFAFGSPNAVSKHLQALEQKGYIDLHRHGRFSKARSVIPLKRDGREPPGRRAVPLVGKIVAGAPAESDEHVEDTLDLTSLGIHNRGDDHFALTVRGDSMVNAHILDGDIVVVRKQSAVKETDVTAVMWNGETTLKYIRRTGDRILLVPANDRLEPIVVTRDNTDSFSILGKVVSVIRTYLGAESGSRT